MTKMLRLGQTPKAYADFMRSMKAPEWLASFLENPGGDDEQTDAQEMGKATNPKVQGIRIPRLVHEDSGSPVPAPVAMGGEEVVAESV
jgi:hypothetical protein